MIEDVIIEIRQAEAQADESIRLAKEKAKAALDAAEAECAAKIADATKTAKQKIKEAVSDAEKKTSTLMDKKTADAFEGGKNDLSGSEKKVDQAVALITERILAKYGNR